MQTDVDFGINAVQVVEHGHVLVEIANGNVPVLGHDQVEPDKMRVGRRQFESEQNLGEHRLVRQSAQHLIDVADRDAASGFSFRRSAFQFGARAGLVLGQRLTGCGGDFFEASRQQAVAHLGEVAVPTQLHAQFGGRASVGRMHEFDVFDMLARGAIDHGGDRFGYVAVRCQAELVEGSEEVVVTGFVSGAPVAHGPGIDDLVIEDVVVIGAADSRLGRVFLAGIAGGSHEARGGAVHAEIVGDGEVNQIFGVDRAIEVIVQIAAFRHVVEKSQQQRGFLAYRVQIARRFLLGSLRRGEAGKKEENQTAANDSRHQAHVRASGKQDCNAWVGACANLRQPGTNT